MKGYLVVREEGTRTLEVNEKVYLSKKFAELVCLEWNNSNILNGRWVVKEIEIDDFKTAEEEKEEEM